MEGEEEEGRKKEEEEMAVATVGLVVAVVHGDGGG